MQSSGHSFFTCLISAACVFTAALNALAENPVTAPLDGIVSFTTDQDPSDKLFVDSGSKKITVTSAVKIHGHADSRIQRAVPGAGSGTVHVANVQNRSGDSLYRVSGYYGDPPVGGGLAQQRPVPRDEWDADYSKDGAHLVLVLNGGDPERFPLNFVVDGWQDDYIGKGVGGGVLIVHLVGGEPDTDYVVDLTDEGNQNGEVTFISPQVTLTRDDNTAQVQINGVTEGGVRMKGTCSNAIDDECEGTVVGLATVSYSPASPIGVWVMDNLTSMTMSATPHVSGRDWLWSKHESITTKNPGGNSISWTPAGGFLSYKAIAGADEWGGALGKDSGTPVLFGLWSCWFRNQLDGPYIETPEQVVSHGNSIFWEKNNLTAADLGPFNITKTVTISYTTVLSGERDETTGDLSKHEAGGSLEAGGKAWGIVKIKGEAHYDYTNEHREELRQKAGYALNSTYETTVGEGYPAITVPAGKKTTIYAWTKSKRTEYKYNVFIDANEDGAAENMAEDLFSVARPFGSSEALQESDADPIP